MAGPTPSGHVTSSAESRDPSKPDPEPEWVERLRAVETILKGTVTVALHQEFLIRNNHTDLQILKNTKVRRGRREREREGGERERE